MTRFLLRAAYFIISGVFLAGLFGVLFSIRVNVQSAIHASIQSAFEVDNVVGHFQARTLRELAAHPR